MTGNTESVFKKLDPVVEDLGNVAIACDEESSCWMGEAAQKGIDRIIKLKELTDRQVKRTGELTGQVDALLEQVKELNQSMDFLNVQYKDICHANRDNSTKATKLEEQVKEYDKALQYIADNENFNHWTSMTESGYAFKERKRIKAMGEK